MDVILFKTIRSWSTTNLRLLLLLFLVSPLHRIWISLIVNRWNSLTKWWWTKITIFFFCCCCCHWRYRRLCIQTAPANQIYSNLFLQRQVSFNRWFLTPHWYIHQSRWPLEYRFMIERPIFRLITCILLTLNTSTSLYYFFFEWILLL